MTIGGRFFNLLQHISEREERSRRDGMKVEVCDFELAKHEKKLTSPLGTL